MESGTFASDAQGVTFLGHEDGEASYELVLGSYEFSVSRQILYEYVVRMDPFQSEGEME